MEQNPNSVHFPPSRFACNTNSNVTYVRTYFQSTYEKLKWFFRCLAEIKTKNTQPSELQVKLSSLKRNVWSGIHSDEKGPLSWGISSFAMNSYFTDSEALLRSCSKKLEELEGEKKKNKEEKKKKKMKIKKISLKVPNADDIAEPVNKIPKTIKKKGKLKHTKSENATYVNNTSFTDIPRNTQPESQKQSETKQSKSRFRKTALVTTAIQTKKIAGKLISTIMSDHSDSDESINSIKKVKKKTKSNKPKLKKSASESKHKN